jgi:two-component system cell cycle sensor histidine kinase/response regulator CckA
MSGAAKATTRPNGPAALRHLPRDHDRDRFRNLFEGAAIGIGICALDGHILECNQALSKMLGYRREELTGMHARELGHDDNGPSEGPVAQMRSDVQGSIEAERRYRRKDGSYLWGRMTMSMVHDSGGEPTCQLALLEDATEHKRAAEKSREAEKMEVIGRLAGGIAHDFNNLLTGVLLYCDLLSDGMKHGSQLRQHVEEIRLAGEQGAALTQQLLAIARKQVPQPRPLLINDVVSSTRNILSRLIGEHVELATILAPRLRTVLADEAQLRQVLLNLVLNARDAMPDGGRVTVRTRNNGRVGSAASTVSLLVEDTGLGMDEEIRTRLFEPFFTTKPAGHGTGLGLVTVQRIVSEAGGAIHVASEPGHGTQIEVQFPALRTEQAVRLPSRRPVTSQAILLVDDHASARNSIQRVLHHAGFRVLPASSGKQALKLFAKHTHEVGILLADYRMPGMNGHELAQALHQQKPDLRVLLISGYHEPGEGPPDHSVEMIRKPFAGRVLLERIRELLNSKGDSPW